MKCCTAVSTELRRENCFSGIFNFGLQKLKEGHNSPQKIDSKFPANMHIYTVCPSKLQVMAVTQMVRALALHPEGWEFESQPRQI